MLLRAGVLCVVAAAILIAPLRASSAEAPAIVVTADTVVSLEIVQPVSTRTHKRGDMFEIALAEPILSAGRVLVPAGVKGVGQVVDAASAGMLGKPAKLVLAARYLNLDGQHVPLRTFRFVQTGKDRADVVMAASLVPYAGLLAIFIHGGEIDVPAGTRAQAKVAGLTPVASAPATPTPDLKTQSNIAP